MKTITYNLSDHSGLVLVTVTGKFDSVSESGPVEWQHGDCLWERIKNHFPNSKGLPDRNLGCMFDGSVQNLAALANLKAARTESGQWSQLEM